MKGALKSRVGSGGHAGGVDRLHPAMCSHMWKPGQSRNPAGHSGVDRTWRTAPQCRYFLTPLIDRINVGANQIDIRLPASAQRTARYRYERVHLRARPATELGASVDANHDRGNQVRSRLSAGGRWIRTIGTPPNFFGRPSIPAQFTFRNINRLPRDRDRWFESISLQRRVRCEPDFLDYVGADALSRP